MICENLNIEDSMKWLRTADIRGHSKKNTSTTFIADGLKTNKCLRERALKVDQSLSAKVLNKENL